MKHRLISIALALAVACSSLPIPALALDGSAAQPPASSSTVETGTESGTSSGTESGTESGAQSGTESGTDSDADSDPDSDADSVPESSTEPTPAPQKAPARPSSDEPNEPSTRGTGTVTYLDKDGVSQSYTGEYTEVTADTVALSGGWYVVSTETTVSNRINVSGNVNLVLSDNTTLTAEKGIRVAAGNSLTIWAQSTDEATMGKLIATVEGNNISAIGGNDGQSVGDITINGGNISATGGAYAAGIGGAGGNVVVGQITINGGDVVARSSGGMAIGTGNTSSSVDNTKVIITGGQVEAIDESGAGIGAPNGSITITGGQVKATGGDGAGIGFGHLRGKTTVTITISGGTVEATSNSSAGIGSGKCVWSSSVANILITGGNVTATSKESGAGIGGSDGFSTSTTSNITITGGVINATGGKYGGAGIGGGDEYSNGTITISGGTVTAVGGGNAADIGNGADSTGIVFSTGTNGSAVIYADEIRADYDAADLSCIVFNSTKTACTLYGTQTLQQSMSIEDLTVEGSMTVPRGMILTIDGALVNRGSIQNNGSIRMEDGASYEGTTVRGNPLEYKAFYLDENGDRVDGVWARELNSSVTELEDGWYIVKGELNMDSLDIVGQPTNLILADDARITIAKEVSFEGIGIQMNIYAQSTDETTMGQLTANEGFFVSSHGQLTINGGSVTAANGSYDAAIYNAGDVNINGGVVKATGTFAGIGGDGSNISISSGNVRGVADYFSVEPGIGGSNSTITISGGIVSAQSAPYSSAAGIGGDGSTVIISGGTVTANADIAGSGAGIGDRNSTVTISGGIVTASGGEGASSDVEGSFSTGTDGHAVIYADTIADTSAQDDWSCVLLNSAKTEGSVYGNVTLTDAWAVPANATLTVPTGTALTVDNLTVPENSTVSVYGALTNGGSIQNEGTILIQLGGSYMGADSTPIPVEYVGVAYLDEKGQPKTTNVPLSFVEDSTTELVNGWYVVDRDVTLSTRLTVTGDVHLILVDNTTLTASAGISVTDGNQLTIYAQCTDENTMGKLIATGGHYNSGIGGGNGTGYPSAAGVITINGGLITANAGEDKAAAIGGSGDSCGTITINGGIVNANGKSFVGIGGYIDGTVTINGGTVNAIGGDDTFGDAGIGGGRTIVTINDGTVTSTSNEFNVAIGGKEIIIRGGTVNATGGTGIGGDNKTVTISGGIVTATGTGLGAGIGAGYAQEAGVITISGGIVTATSTGSAGIGNGKIAYSQSPITISGGVVTAVGGDGFPSIGGTNTTFSTGTDGHAVIFADTIEDTSNQDNWSCILLNSAKTEGSVYGNVTLTEDWTNSEDTVLTVPADTSLTVPEDVVLTNNGTIQVELGGSYNNNSPVGNPVQYQIGWDTDGDGTADKTEYVSAGETPVFDGEPTKPSDAQFTYTFDGWTPAVTEVSAAVKYTAQFKPTIRQYAVTAQSGEGYTIAYNDYTDGDLTDYGTRITFTVAIADGYSADNLVVKANDTVLTAQSGLYSVEVQGPVQITVAGVADTTAPEGTITIKENSFKKLISEITFGLFFNENVEVRFSAQDAGSGVATLEYIRSETLLSEEQLKARTDWTPYKDVLSETAEDAKTFVYYGKATDHAGNVTLFGADGVIFDTTAPTIAGVTNGGIYYTTQTVTVTDSNLDTVALNGEPASSSVRLPGDIDQSYTLTAQDKAGNRTEWTVTMRPISDLEAPLTGLTTDNVTSQNKDDLEQTLATVESLLQGSSLTESEKQKLETISSNVQALLDALNNAQQAGSTEAIEKVENVAADNVTPDDKDDLEAAKEDLETALNDHGSNYTDEEKAQLEAALDRIESALETLDKVQSTQDTVTALPDTVEPDDLETIEKIESAKEQYDQLTEHEKELLGTAVSEKLDSLMGALKAYKILSGDGSVWTIGGSDGLTITANGSPVRLTALLVDGKTLAAENYTVRSGSTIVTLLPSYLNSLTPGTHTLTFVYTNGQTSATFTVKAAATTNANTNTNNTVLPQTNDSNHLVLWMSLLAASAMGLFALALIKRKLKQL